MLDSNSVQACSKTLRAENQQESAVLIGTDRKLLILYLTLFSGAFYSRLLAHVRLYLQALGFTVDTVTLTDVKHAV